MLLVHRLAAAAAVLCLAAAQLPDFPHGGGTCADEWDCSLGGTCSASGTCDCDIWWTGEHCAYLNLQPPVDTEGGTCGAGFAGYYSWGGRALQIADTWHVYASFMCNHATLNEWTTMSSSAHLIAPSPAGPYEWAPDDCVGDICTPPVIPWSHNTVALASPTSPRVQIWHIGDGVVPSPVWSPCYNKSQVGAVPAPMDNTPMPLRVAAGPGNTAYVAASDDPAGPFTREFNNTGIVIDFNGSWTSALAGNPAPLLLPNGSALLYFTATPCPANSGALAANCIAVATASSWAGPYSLNAAKTPVSCYTNSSGGLSCIESEDPFVFIDPRGNYQ